MTPARLIHTTPAAPLSPYVECYWILAVEQGQTPDVQYMPADGRVDLMFSFAAGSRRTAVDGSRVCDVHSPSFVIGARTKGYRIEHFGAPVYVAVRLKPGGLSAFTRLPLSELTDDSLDMDCIWGADTVRQIEQELHDAASPPERTAVLDRFLLDHLNPPDHLTRLLYAAGQMGLTDVDFSMPDWAAHLNLSQKHFERLFARYIGFRPSLYARVVRFQHALYRPMLMQGRVNLGKMAAQLGYYDQAHFAKDFRHFSGSSPNNFFATKHEFVQISRPAQVVELLQDFS